MSKKNAFLVVALILTNSICGQQNSDILKKWDASNKFRGNILSYCAKGNKLTRKYTADSSKPASGSLKVKIVESKQKSPTDIQLSFLFRKKVEKGTKCKIKISLQSNQPGEITATAIMHGSPWRKLAKKSYITAKLQANERKEIIIEFSAEKDFTNVRIPCLYLGKLTSGTELSITSVAFEKVISSAN